MKLKKGTILRNVALERAELDRYGRVISKTLLKIYGDDWGENYYVKELSNDLRPVMRATAFKMDAADVHCRLENDRFTIFRGVAHSRRYKKHTPITIEKVRTLTIEYKIVSQKCLKSIVSGVKSFGDDKTALRFIKRLKGLKNALCMRSDTGYEKALRNDCSAYMKNDGALYSLSYNCKTV